MSQSSIRDAARSAGKLFFGSCAALACASLAHAQVASVQYRVSFNGALGAPIVVSDNGPGDGDGAPGQVLVTLPMMTNGTMTLAPGLTIWGFKIPGVNGRNLLVTAIDGWANAGSFPFAAGTIDIYACYTFNGPGLTVPAPNVFTRHVDGTFENFVDGSIDLAGVRYNAVPNGACSLAPGDPGAFLDAVGPDEVPPQFFFHTLRTGFLPNPCVDITTVTRLIVYRNGDEVSLPGSVSASVVASSGTCSPCCTTGGPGGPIPTSGTGDGSWPTVLPSAPLSSSASINVPAGASVLKSIKLNGISHTFAGDLMFVLETPNGHKHNLLTTQPADPNVDFNNNNFEIVDQEETCASGVPPFNWAAGAASSGTYAQTFGGWTSGNFGIFNTPIEQIPIESGTWTLYVYDWVGLDVGSLTSWDLCFGDPAVPPTPGSAPTLVSPANGATIYGPVTLSWNAASCATSYEIDVDGEIYGPLSATTYTFSPAAGVHTWKVRGLNASGAGPDSTSQSFTAVMPPSGCNGSSLTTLFVSNNGGSAGGQVFFDVNVTNAAGITVAQLDTNTSLAAGTQFGMDVYTKSGSFVGSENNSGAWTLSASGSGISAGTDQASLVEFTDFVLAPGSHGVALVMVGAAHRYSGTSASPPPTFFSNADLSITGGKALNVPWTGTPFSPRMWNGTVRYDCTSPVSVTDCQLLPTVTQSCSSVAGWSGSPSASSASPFTLTFSGLNAQVNGVVFYGINGPSSASWSPESNLCIKAPTQRLNGVSGAFGSTGGSIGSCNGQYSFDMNAVIQGFGYLGTPMAAGQMVEVQAWERDPASSKTTNLSDALSFTVGP